MSLFRTQDPAESSSKKPSAKITAYHNFLQPRRKFYLDSFTRTGNVENCFVESVKYLEAYKCAFVIHKLPKEISSLTAFRILYDFLSKALKFAGSYKHKKKCQSAIQFLQSVECSCKVTKCTCCVQACQPCGNVLLPRR